MSTAQVLPPTIDSSSAAAQIPSYPHSRPKSVVSSNAFGDLVDSVLEPSLEKTKDLAESLDPSSSTKNMAGIIADAAPSGFHYKDGQPTGASLDAAATNAGSRKSILAGMRTSRPGSSSAGDASSTSSPPDADRYSVANATGGKFVSQTDAVLSQQRTGEEGRRHSRTTSVSSKRASTLQTPAEENTAAAAAAADTSVASNGGNRMSRLLRRATSKGDSSAGSSPSLPNKSSNGKLSPSTTSTPDKEKDADAASVKSKSSFKRLSLRVPKMGLGLGGFGGSSDQQGRRNSSTGSVSDGGAATPTPAAAAPEAATANGNANAAAYDAPAVPAIPKQYQQEASTPAVAQKEEEVHANGNGKANGDAPADAPSSGGVIGAIVGGAAAAGAAAAAAASAVVPSLGNGNGAAAKDEEEDDDEEFHDAAPVNDRSQQVAQHDAAPAADDSSSSVAASSTGLGSRSDRPSSVISSSNTTAATEVDDDAPEVDVDGQMKTETPEYVKNKAAKVAKLRFDDVKQDEDDLKLDIKNARGALHLFLNSRMLEAEAIIKKYADRKLYYALGAALIAVIKGFMTFEPEDLATAISFCKDTIHIAQLLRKPTNSVANFGRFVRGTGQSPTAMHGMTLVQRHAELVYAESSLLKSVMGILYSGDFFAFVSEALNMRNAYGIYRSLSKYVDWADEQAQRKRGNKTAIDESIDEDFRSGVYLGSGLISMILGLLPGKVLKIMEVFGYTGDCVEALKILSKAGEWSPNPKHTKPGMPIEEEGIRRQICDMALLLYHLVISSFLPINGVDINMADKVLHYNLDRYPQGVFFLYFSGRLYSTQGLAEKAIKQFEKARVVQKEYVQLQHISVWDSSLCYMSLADWKGAQSCFEILLAENNWSKAVYNYGKGVNMYQQGGMEKEAGKLIIKTPGLMQRIAGKSIPLEKFTAKKAKKFQENGRLLLPAIEFSYTYHCITNAPRYILADEHLPLISDALREIHKFEKNPEDYHSGEEEYYDDFALAHFLRAVTLRNIAHPEKHAKLRPRESPIPVQEAEEQAEMSLKNIIKLDPKSISEGWLLYFAHYELGRLYVAMGRKEEAKAEFDLVLSGKNFGDKRSGKKYSLQNMCLLRSNGALNSLEKA